jgi:hypothetical protein
MTPTTHLDPTDVQHAILRAAFIVTGLFILMALALAPANMLFAGGLALVLGMGQGVASLRRDAAPAPSGAGLLRAQE